MSLKTNLIDLSIVIPALNEEKRIGKTLDHLAKFLQTDPLISTLTCEVIVVNADSSDDTFNVATKHGKPIKNFKILRPGPRVGKGRDVQFGMLRAQGDKVVYMDADLATPLRHLPQFFKEAKNFEIVAGTRNIRKHHDKFSRQFISIVGNVLYRLLGGVWTEDSQCGFKMFSKDAAQLCFGKQTIQGWGFDMEILTIARSNRVSMSFVRINDWKDVPGGTFDLSNALKSSLSSLHDLVIICKNRLLGTYR